jgi:3-oxoacyl-[acyl-carrier-protein] synthase-3
MLKTPSARIIATGRYLPEKILSNADLEKIVDTTDEWIVSRTGMKERRIAGTEEFTSTMGTLAAKQALEKAGLKPSDIDCILFATITPDYLFPSTACCLQKELGCIGAAAMDIQAACTGYLYALSVAKSFIESRTYRNVLIVASEKLSSIVNYEDRNTCVLFGDGACACIVSGEGAGLKIHPVNLGADGEQADLLLMPAGGCRAPATIETISAKMHSIHMDGKEVFKHAVRRMEAAALKSIEAAQLTPCDIKWLIPHQANMRIIEAIAKRFDIPMTQVFLTIHKYGNTSASSIGIALDELLSDKEILDGDHLLLFAFGAGLTWGATVLTRISQ